MPTTDSASRYFEALSDAYGAMIETARTAATNRLALSQRLLEETQQAQHRALDLSRRIIEQPADISGNVTALMEATAQAQTQALSVARAWFEGTPEYQAQGQALLERIAKANQEMVSAALAATRDFYAANPWTSLFRAAETAEAR